VDGGHQTADVSPMANVTGAATIYHYRVCRNRFHEHDAARWCMESNQRRCRTSYEVIAISII